MSVANPLGGSPRILGELRKIGIDVAKSTVEKYMVRRRKPQHWCCTMAALGCEMRGQCHGT
jgi:hypothetical protein